MKIRKNYSFEYYQLSRYGSSDKRIVPFPSFLEATESANEKYKCSPEVLKSTSASDYRSSYMCFNIEVLFFLGFLLGQEVLGPIINGPLFNPNLSNNIMDNLWDIQFNFVYERLFFPVFSSMVKQIRKNAQSDGNPYVIGSIIFLVLAIPCVIVTVFLVNKKIKEIKSILSLLHHLQSSVIYRIPPISKILSGQLILKNMILQTGVYNILIKLLINL
jgi:hypothetical protein